MRWMHNMNLGSSLPFTRNIRGSPRMPNRGRLGLMPAYPLTCIRFSLGCISFVKIPGQRSKNDRLYGSGVAFDPPSVQRGISGRTDRQKRESVKYRDSNLTGTYWAPLTTGGVRGVSPIGRRIIYTLAIINPNRPAWISIHSRAPKRGRFRHFIMKSERTRRRSARKETRSDDIFGND